MSEAATGVVAETDLAVTWCALMQCPHIQRIPGQVVQNLVPLPLLKSVTCALIVISINTNICKARTQHSERACSYRYC